MLLAPVRVVREQVQIIVDHTDRAKHSIQDQYTELQDKTGCKWIFVYIHCQSDYIMYYLLISTALESLLMIT